MKALRLQEIKTLFYRLLLCYVFYQFARLLFWWYNSDLIAVDSISEFFKLAYYGIAFDTTAILYINALFIVLSLFPLVINTSKGYQKFLFWFYFITNGLAYMMNFGDFVYYKFSQQRLTSAVLDVVANESNIFKIFWVSIGENLSIILSYLILIAAWIFLFTRQKVKSNRPDKFIPYFGISLLWIVLSGILTIGGIRGDFKHSTRPINIVDASRHTQKAGQANVVLNSVFSFFRTISKRGFKEAHLVDQDFVKQTIHSVKQYGQKLPAKKPNIVIFIVESFGREYSGAFNAETSIPNYESFTPFVDSLAKESLIFPNSFANGRQSIHGMSSVLASIPALKDAFTSSPYANQKIQSIVSVCNELGYNTSFYHGAPNGSMGFLGFSNILGFDAYWGKTEYNNDDDFDGLWAIWDEPFLQYFAKNVGKKEPFMTTVFTASSHHPYKIPESYNGKFKKGYCPMHEPIQYTDYALKRYFETAKQQDWFQNTIFVITGDHTNIAYYPEYKKAMNRFAVPVLFYSPNPAYQLKGVRADYAQQIDIYPTLADLIGYQKPIRTWGRSLVAANKEAHLIVNSDGIQQQFIIGQHICTFDGNTLTGIYNNDDLALSKNLKEILPKEIIEQKEMICKAWYQDYMNKVIHKEL